MPLVPDDFDVFPNSHKIALRKMTSHSNLSPVRGRNAGFTLVELLVSIVIVAVLATLVAVAAHSIRERSKEVGSLNNMRQIGTALQLYAGEHGHYPETSHTVDLDHAWIKALETHLDDYDEVRICPADPRGAERLAAGGTSYVLNSFLFVPEIGPWGEVIGRPLNRPAAIPHLSRTIMAFTCADSVGPGPGNDHTHSNLWSSWQAVCADISPSRFGGNGDPHDASGRTNYLFADGHVESISAGEIKRKTEKGINIAQPPGL